MSGEIVIVSPVALNRARSASWRAIIPSIAVRRAAWSSGPFSRSVKDSLKAQDAASPFCADSQISVWLSVSGTTGFARSAAGSAAAAAVSTPPMIPARAHLAEAIVESGGDLRNVFGGVRRVQEQGEPVLNVNAAIAKVIEQAGRRAAHPHVG